MIKNQDPESDLPTELASPARRALAGAGYTRLEQFTQVSEDEVLKLHGMGPKALCMSILSCWATASDYFQRGSASIWSSSNPDRFRRVSCFSAISPPSEEGCNKRRCCRSRNERMKRDQRRENGYGKSCCQRCQINWAFADRWKRKPR